MAGNDNPGPLEDPRLDVLTEGPKWPYKNPPGAGYAIEDSYYDGIFCLKCGMHNLLLEHGNRDVRNKCVGCHDNLFKRGARVSKQLCPVAIGYLGRGREEGRHTDPVYVWNDSHGKKNDGKPIWYKPDFPFSWRFVAKCPNAVDYYGQLGDHKDEIVKVAGLAWDRNAKALEDPENQPMEQAELEGKN